MLRVRSLGSGSTGNATLVEVASSENSCLLVDCGFSLRQFQQRLEAHALDMGAIHAVFVTHEHKDHVGCCVQLAEKLGIPLWMSHGTYLAIGSPELRHASLHIATDLKPFHIGELEIQPFTVPHDAREPLQLRCSYQNQVLGIATDLGWGSPHVMAQLYSCETVLLECNYDADLLDRGPYPAFLKQRIRGQLGHLDNKESMRIVGDLRRNGKLTHVIAAHLSEKNNCPDLVNRLLRNTLAQVDGMNDKVKGLPSNNTQNIQLTVACPKEGTQWLNV